jgi:hypothetical protein
METIAITALNASVADSSMYVFFRTLLVSTALVWVWGNDW